MKAMSACECCGEGKREEGKRPEYSSIVIRYASFFCEFDLARYMVALLMMIIGAKCTFD